MPARRLGAPLRAGSARGRPVRFTFDGRSVEAFEGESVAAALLAAGQSTLSRSFRFHRPRGLMCSTGQCGWCECEVDGVPSVRTCRVPARDGLAVRGEHALPSVRHDLLALVGLAARWIPPTFYHHRFLRPRRLRKRYLDVLRWFGGRGRLAVGARTTPPGRVRQSRRVDVLIVGGGPAGIAAAIGAAEQGAQVLVVEARGDAEMAAPAEARQTAPGVEVARGASAVGWYDGAVLVVDETTLTEVRAGAIVAATGSYELVPAVPGADRPGVISARLAAQLIEDHGIVAGERAVLAGDGPDADRAAAALEGAGAAVVARVPTEAVRRVDGRSRVAGVAHVAAGRETRVAADLLILSDRTPALDLLLAAGAAVDWSADTLVPRVDEEGRTTVEGLYAAGSAAGRPSGGPDGDERARATGRAAARAALGVERVAAPADAPVPSGPPGPTIRPRQPVPDAAVVCFCEDVRASEIRDEVRAGYGTPELVKRRTGALTGPCQGKYCLTAFCRAADLSDTAGLPTSRPPLRPIRLGDLVVREPAES